MKRITLFSVFLFLFFPFFISEMAAQPTNGLIGKFPMNQFVIETQGNHPVKILGEMPAMTSDRNDNPNCALNFNGSGHAIIEDGIDFSLGTNKKQTISLWFKRDDLVIDWASTLYSKNKPDGDNGDLTIMFSTPNSLLIFAFPYYSQYNSIDGYIPDLEWHHLAIIINTGDQKVYFDGVLIDDTDYTINHLPMGGILEIGTNFHGSIDDIFVYDRPLNVNEILELYAATADCSLIDTVNTKNVTAKIFHDLNMNNIKDLNEEYLYDFDLEFLPGNISVTTGFQGKINAILDAQQPQLLTIPDSTNPWVFTIPQSYIDLSNYAPYIYDYGEIGIFRKPTKEITILGTLFNDFNGNNIFDGNDFYLEDFEVEFQPSGISTTTGSLGVFSQMLDSGTVQTLTIPIAMQNDWSFSVPQTPINLIYFNQDTFELGVIGIKPTDKTLASFTATFPSTLARSRNAECKIQLNNEGNTDLNGTLQVDISGQQLFRKFIYPANHTETELNDSTVRYTFDVTDLAPLQNLLTGYTLFSQAPTGSRIRINYNYTDDSGYTISGSSEIQIVAPLDPNYIAVDHTRITPQFVTEQNRLNYTVHFQNLGSSPAENVIITQNLPGTLRSNSIQITSASDEVTLISQAQSQDTILEWHFNGINLSSAGADSIGSLGYISFSVLPYEIQMKDTIRLDAEIYFDSEDPVATNFALTSLICELHNGNDMVDITTFDALCFGDLTGGIILNSNIDTISLDLLLNNSINIQYTNDSISLAAGNYVLRSLDKLGCTQDQSFRVDQPDKLTTSIIEISQNEKEILIGGGTPPYAIYWQNGYTGYDLEKLPPGLNTYTVTDANGCTVEGTYEKIVLKLNGQITSTIKIFPNPSKDVINVYWDQVQFDLEILDTRGANLLNSSNILNTESISIKDLNPGIYYLRLISKQGMIRYLKFSKL